MVESKFSDHLCLSFSIALAKPTNFHIQSEITLDSPEVYTSIQVKVKFEKITLTFKKVRSSTQAKDKITLSCVEVKYTSKQDKVLKHAQGFLRLYSLGQLQVGVSNPLYFMNDFKYPSD